MQEFRWSCVLFLCLAMAASGQETIVDQPLAPHDAAKSMLVPEGFHVSLFAGEPDVAQPIGFCIDDRDRLWVAEAYSYPEHKSAGNDRILILEDTDGDGQHDKRTVFYEGLNYVTGIEFGFGGAWVMSPPNLYFIPDRDADDRPDGAPEVVLDGFGNHANAHNLANGFAWGPDGWLYGTHGRTNWSMIGTPGTPESQRIRFDGGVYRYHPVRKVWEAYADGTTNPWGIDWNDVGHAFVCNCVNPHLFQVIQGAHYEPWRGRESSQFAYQRIDTIADHLHFVGLSNVRKGLGSAEEDAAGGGHAHCGTMIYLGDMLPAKYRNTLFTNNIHGRRINNDIPQRSGSGYVASHGPDLMRAQDPWFMGVTLAYGAAGEVYASDWSDTGECHSTRNTRRHTGRIYQLRYGERKIPAVDLSSLPDSSLVELQLHANDWYVRHARRLLHERAAAGKNMRAANSRLLEMFEKQLEVPKKLRALWALNVCNGLDEEFMIAQLQHPSDDVRAWVVTLLFDQPVSDKCLTQLARCAEQDSSSLVRLNIASGLQRLPLANRWQLAFALSRHAEDNNDQNLPLMNWYACEPLIEDDLLQFVRLAATSQLSRVRINAARRIASAESSTVGLELLSQQLASNLDVDVAQQLLDGMLQGLEGRRSVSMPASWPAAYNRIQALDYPDLLNQAVRLAVIFDDASALEALRQTALNATEPTADRIRAIGAVVSKRLAGFDEDLIQMLEQESVRPTALRGLAAYNHANTAKAILERYSTMGSHDKQEAILVLASRESWAGALLEAVDKQHIPANELTAFVVRQIHAFGNEELTQRLTKLWGKLAETPQARIKQIASIKSWLNSDVLLQANLTAGAELFKKHCASCHLFFGQGGKIGPDITGAQRHSLDSMLENIVAPNAAVANDYQMEILQTIDGRTITGLIETEDDKNVVVQTLNERMVLPLEELAGRKKSNLSIMPEGLLDALSDEQIRDLMGYLQRIH